MNLITRIPVFRFFGTILISLLIFGLTLTAVMNRPTVDLPLGARLQSIDGIPLLPTDTIEEPDQLGTFADMQAFFDRQSVFAESLAHTSVEAEIIAPDGSILTQELAVRGSRLSDLPFVFWFQNAVGLIAVFVSGWVFSLRGGAAVLSLLALGYGLQISASAASVYGSRQLAIPGDFFLSLSNLNHLGTAIFGTALVAIFMMFPRQLVHPKWLLVPITVFGLFHLSDTLRWTETPSFVIAIVLQLILAFGFGVVQWRRSKGEPIDRAGLRWFSLCTFSGCILFVAFSVLPPFLAISDTGLVSQGYAFGFFATIHLGLAFGIGRFQLFSLDKFTYYMWLWLGGGAIIIGLDFALLYVLQSQPWASLAVALLVGSFLYFPLRQFLLTRLLSKKSASIVGRVQDIVAVGLAPTQDIRNTSWDELLRSVFLPASEIQVDDSALGEPQIDENGLTLRVPAARDMKARRLRYANYGRRLFSRDDLDVIATMTQIYATVFDSRAAYETGVTEERGRIARDVHDNIGAQLLSALHTPEAGRKDTVLRDTLSDLRTIVNEGFQNSVQLDEVLLDIRHEMGERAELHEIQLNWPLPDMPDLGAQETVYGVANSIRAILREATSNTIKHAQASEISVTLALSKTTLNVSYADNGIGFSAESDNRGNGLKNIEARAHALGGKVTQFTSSTGSGIALSLPLYQVQDVQR